MKENGDVRYNYIHAKQILEVFRLLCAGKGTPYEKLCKRFNNETAGGQKMDKYTKLLHTAIGEISKVFRKKVNQKLTTDRGAVLLPKSKQASEAEQFELVTWLVIV